MSEVEYPDQPSCMHIFRLQFPDYYFHKKKTKGGKAPGLSLPLEHASSITLAAVSAAERATWIEVLRIYAHMLYIGVCIHAQIDHMRACCGGGSCASRGAAAFLCKCVCIMCVCVYALRETDNTHTHTHTHTYTHTGAAALHTADSRGAHERRQARRAQEAHAGAEGAHREPAQGGTQFTSKASTKVRQKYKY